MSRWTVERYFGAQAMGSEVDEVGGCRRATPGTAPATSCAAVAEFDEDPQRGRVVVGVIDANLAVAFLDGKSCSRRRRNRA